MSITCTIFITCVPCPLWATGSFILSNEVILTEDGTRLFSPSLRSAECILLAQPPPLLLLGFSALEEKLGGSLYFEELRKNWLPFGLPALGGPLFFKKLKVSVGNDLGDLICGRSLFLEGQNPLTLLLLSVKGERGRWKFGFFTEGDEFGNGGC